MDRLEGKGIVVVRLNGTSWGSSSRNPPMKRHLLRPVSVFNLYSMANPSPLT